MAVDTTWTDPSTAGSIDLNTDQVLTETIYDKLLSNLKHLGGTKGTVACKVTHSTTQSLTSGATGAVTFNTETYDTDTMHDPTTNPDRITITQAGIYLITGHLEFASNATGHRLAGIVVSNSYQARQHVPAVNGDETRLSVVALQRLAVGDYIQLYALQNSGGALNVQSGNAGACSLSVIRLGV